MGESKPEKLYRGIVLIYKELKEAAISDVDMYPPYEPEINEEGRKVVGDGNEYGVYMSDNRTMVFDAYSRPDRRGTNIGEDIRVGTYDMPIEIPCVGIAYEIDTDGVDVRKPWITSVLSGHYNNGFEGDEWIADSIPSDKYHIIRARIGVDLLHNAEDLELDDASNIKERLIEKVEERKIRLEAFKEDISSLNINQRRNLSRDKLELLKLFYGENGAKYLEESQIDVSTPDGMMKRILKQSLLDNDGKIDTETLDLYTRIWVDFKRIKDTPNVELLKNKFETAIERDETSRAKFVERKREGGEEANTISFDRRIEKLKRAVGAFDSTERKEGISLKEEAIKLGIEAGVRTEMMSHTENVITPEKEEISKTV